MTRPPAGQSTDGPAPESPAAESEVLLTARQHRRAQREARRQAKDEAYELRMQRKRKKDGTTWRGHHIVDTDGLAQAFPEPESPEILSSTVRRRITHATVLLLLLALVVAGLVLVGMVQRGELELKLGAGRPSPTQWACPTETLDYPANKAVSVNIFNGSTVEGLAGKVGAELKKRGYQVKEVDNKGVALQAPTVITSGPAGRAAAFNLQRNFPDSEYVEDNREDATVDVVVTGLFVDLVAAKQVDQSAGVLSCPRLSPAPSEGIPSEGATVPAG
ncbi:LytR C-terminal domain-containing protein [Arthrobacter sp. lap29]|uniref:LytR C-terminal domain-containing protein n=1 Tax=Arthrobacter sp. lap29 TaxID=3056122 RepID=UPI0028F717AE|nr:LytR C-terminal domain-containing protein [Arthrobacter sp. lap29]